MVQIIISTDLDGTLIDHHDYSFSAALPALQLCREARVPVIFNTSKNAAEVLALQEEMGVVGPYIVENGSALIMQSKAVRFGIDRQKILAFIDEFRKRNPGTIEGFNDWSLSELIAKTGLSKRAAELAQLKEYSEPFLWHGEKPQFKELEAAAKNRELTVTKGGRFFHLQGQCNKATPLNYLKANPRLLSSGDEEQKLICLGDNHNDVAMLACADIAVCIKSPVTDYPHLETSKNQERMYTEQFGPAGWNAAVKELLTRFC